MHVIVASDNPVKKSVMKKSVKLVYPEDTHDLYRIQTPSGVRSMPLSAEEIFQGAENRLEWVRSVYEDADMWAALEGGVEEKAYGMVCFGYVLVRSNGSAGLMTNNLVTRSCLFTQAAIIALCQLKSPELYT